MIRVVLDTNIIVSALLSPLGPPAQVFSLAVDGVVQLCVSGKVYDEYDEVIRRPHLGRSEKVIAASSARMAFGSNRLTRYGHAPIRMMTSFSNVRMPRALITL